MEKNAVPFQAGPNSLVYIPAGVPHHNWNEGPEPVTYLEFVPGQLGSPAVSQASASVD